MDEIRVRSKINRVSVFPDRALITRRCFVELEPGYCEIVFEEMPSTIIPGSLRAKGAIMGGEPGSGGLRLLHLEHRPGRPEEGGPEGRERKRLNLARDRVRNSLDNLRLRRSFFLGLADRSRDHISRTLVQRELSVEEVEKISDFLFGNLARTDGEIRKLQEKEKDLQAKLSGLEEEAEAPPGVGRPSHVVRVGVHVPSKLKGVLELTYVIPGASWTPFYEIHSMPGDEKITLRAYGIISQVAGESWPDVKLSLSTHAPPVGASRPELEPLFLRPPVNGEDGKESSESSPDGKGGRHPKASFVPEGSGWDFEVAKPGTVRADGTPFRALIGQWDLKARYEWVCIPKISEFAFLRARLRNTRHTDLLPGQMNIFSNSEFVGTAEIPFVSPSEEFEVYLGVDSAIRIRHQTEREGKGKGGVISKVQRKGLRVKMSLQNQKASEKPVILIERIPVSRHKEIRVRDPKFSEEPKKKARNGILTWSFSLKPREKREITYSYTIEYPRGMPLQI